MRYLILAAIALFLLPSIIQAASTTVSLNRGDTLAVDCGVDFLSVAHPTAKRGILSCVEDVGAIPSETPTPAPTATSTPVPTGTPTSTPSSTPAPTQTPVVGTVGWSTGYDVGWLQDECSPSVLPWDALTHAIHFGLLANTDGTTDRGEEHSTDPVKMQAFVEEAHLHGVKALLAIGGVEDEDFDEACSPAIRSTFVNNVVSYVDVYGYDGIDLDMERDYIVEHFRDCVALFRERLGPNKLLTIASDDWQEYLMKEVVQYVDQINIMSYWTPNTGTDKYGRTLTQVLARFTNAGIPKAKLGIGMGLGSDEGVDTTAARCTGKANRAVNGGYGGIMQWLPTDDLQIRGSYVCMNAIAGFVP